MITEWNRRIVLIEYFFTATQLLAFGIRSDLRQPLVMPIQIDIGALSERMAALAPRLLHSVASLVRWPVLTQCLAPILHWSAPDDLVCIIPSGPLFHVPFHAVISEDGQPLIFRNAIFYAPSATSLRHCIHNRHCDKPSRTAAVFGNPQGNLVAAGREAATVAKALQTSALQWKAATKQAFIHAMNSSDIVHYSGHATFNDADPLASGLKLADGVLTTRDFLSLRGRPIELVTLSGCVTGYNNIRPGDEILGLTRAVLYAGASSLLVTLWNIEDSSASFLMKSFYHRWTETRQSKVDALRGAQQDAFTRYGGEPSRWAPYQLIGDWC